MNKPMQIETATIERILPTRIWIESDMMGGRHVVLQHEGCEPFDYASFGYDYRYTSNSGTMEAARSIALALGATEPIEQRTRDFEVDEAAVKLYEAAEQAATVLDELDRSLYTTDGQQERIEAAIAALRDCGIGPAADHACTASAVVDHGAAATAAPPSNEAQPVALALQADNERLRARIKELEGSRGELWCSACHEYVKDCCAGDARACPLIFPKD